MCIVTCVHLYKRLCFCVPYSSEPYRAEEGRVLISSPGCPVARVKAVVMDLLLRYFSRYCKIKNVLSIFCLFLFLYCLCEKYYKHITVQYYVTDFVSWVSRLTLLDLNKLDLCHVLSEWSLFIGDLLYVSAFLFLLSFTCFCHPL